MTRSGETILWLRVAAVPAALERVLRQLRARLGGSLDLTLARGDDDAHELRVVLDVKEPRAGQVRAELLALRDVMEARLLPADGSVPSREMALVRLSGADEPSGDADTEAVSTRVLGRNGASVTLEVTGEAADVDRILSSWRAAGRLAGVSRTGAVIPPGNSAPGPDAQRG